MNWRPENSLGWMANRDHCIKIILDTCDNKESDHINIFEAGADAMLEVRKAASIKVRAGDLPESVRLMLRLDSQKYGWLNFIPERAE